MSREFKETFFSSLLVVLLVVSNLLCLKLTSLFDLTVAVSVFIFPFTFLCTLMLFNLGGKKVAYRGIMVAAIIQVLITVIYAMAVKLGTQTEVPDLAIHVNEVFKVDEVNLFASLVSFITSNCLLIYIYDTFKKYGKELYGIALGLLAASFSDVIIYQLINLQNNDFMFIINTLLSNIIVSIIMLIIITILFYIMKEKDLETVEIKNMNIDINKYKSDDLAIEDVIMDKKETKPAVKKTKSTTKKTNRTNSKKPTGTRKNASKSQKSGQKRVNKKDN